MASRIRRDPEPLLDAPLPPEQVPWPWLAAPLPGAELWGLRDSRLQRLESAAPVGAGAAVVEALLAAPAAAGAVPLVAARGSAGAIWRLRRCAKPAALQLWWAQPLELSRRLLFEQLRGALGRLLAGAVQHNLRGPLQTLTFNADIALRLFESGRADGRYLANIDTIKRCVRELEARQTAAVELWLAPAEAAAPVSVHEMLEQAAALLRGHLAVAGVKLVAQDWALLETAVVHDRAQYARIALLALLLMAGSGAAGRQAELRVRALQGPDALDLELDAPAAGAALAPTFASAEAVAAVALLLEPCGMLLESPAADLIRLRCRASGSGGDTAAGD